jgi:hypothetical protein
MADVNESAVRSPKHMAQATIKHPLSYRRPPHWLWRASQRLYVIAAAAGDIWMIVTGRLTLHRAWQSGLDQGRREEYIRIIVNGGDLVRIKYEAFNLGVEMACRRIESTNDETSIICALEAARELKTNYFSSGTVTAQTLSRAPLS